MVEISEQKRLEIAKEAKQILDNFSKALSGVKISNRIEKKEIGGFREEDKGMKGDENFRKIMFVNAPSKEGDFIIAEKKKW